jgi:hypothetical protein
VAAPDSLDFTMTSHRKVKVSYGKENSRNKGVQLPDISSTQSCSDLECLRQNLLNQLLKDKSIEDLGGDSNTEKEEILIYYHDLELGSDVEYEPDVILKNREKNLSAKL